MLIARHRGVVAGGLPRLGTEILHRLVVQKAVDGLGVGVRVALVHLAADRDAPLRRPDREGKVADDHRQDDQHIAPVELEGENGEHQYELDDGGNERHQRHARDVLDPRATALEDTREPSRLAFQMEAEREAMHMLERGKTQLPHGMHRDLRKQPLTRLGEHHHRDPRQPIENRRQDRRADQPSRLRRRHTATRYRHQGIRRPLERERHRDGNQLRHQHQCQREHDATLQIRPVVGPDVRRERAQGP